MKKKGSPYVETLTARQKLSVTVTNMLNQKMMQVKHYNRQSALRLRTPTVQVEAFGAAADNIANAVSLSVLFVGLCYGISLLERR